MSPNRQQLLQLMAGGAMSLAATPTIKAAELTEHEELIDIRDRIASMSDRHDVGARTVDVAKCVAPLFDMRLLEICPHDRSAWRCNEIDRIDSTRASFTCPACRASWTFPHIDGRYAGRR